MENTDMMKTLTEKPQYKLVREWSSNASGSVVRTGNDVAALEDHARYLQSLPKPMQVNTAYYVLAMDGTIVSRVPPMGMGQEAGNEGGN